MSAADIRSIALFFYFSLMNEKLAQSASSKVVHQLKIFLKKRHDQVSKFEMHAKVVELTQEHWSRFQTTAKRQGVVALSRSLWSPPKQTDLGPWRQFYKESDSKEFLSVIWSRILGYEDQEIASGLRLSEGTVRHRVSRGLRHLGSMYRLDRLDE